MSLIKKNEMGIDEGQLEPETVTSLPVLCIDDGKMILRFSEFFWYPGACKKVKTDHHKHTVNKGILHVGCNEKIQNAPSSPI
jgi:transcription initiation factor TFIID subunit 1